MSRWEELCEVAGRTHFVTLAQGDDRDEIVSEYE
jgi:hypothetical protein